MTLIGLAAAAGPPPAAATLPLADNEEQYLPWGTYGPCIDSATHIRTRGVHVIEVGKSLDNVPFDGIDVLDCHPFDGPGGTFVVDCGGLPYSYCLRNQNDGVGNDVTLGVRECATDLRSGLSGRAARFASPCGPTPPTCFGQPATITGNGIVNGTPGDDVIITGNTADTISGGGGNDLICSRGGADYVRGNAGNDSILAGADNDNIGGNGGNDLVRGVEGNDAVAGDGGDDTVRGDGGDDRVHGGAGVDVITTGDGNDRLTGDAGAPDSCNGGPGTDAVGSGGGCETLINIP
jgi:Ca2+-binding RTX toxin-like protein